MSLQFHNIGIIGKYRDSSVQPTLDRLTQHLEAKGVTVVSLDNADPESTYSRGLQRVEELDLAIVVGGDGTMLNAARSLAGHEVPLIGVNLGRLGFLTDVPADQMCEVLDNILAGEYSITERALLRAEIHNDGEVVYSAIAVNDVVVSKGETARLLDFPVYVNDMFVTDVRGDGMIVATPTGSTAYALSAGGPICQPSVDAIELVPICPHTLSNRPILLNDSSRIVIGPVSFPAGSAHVSIDGHLQYTFRAEERVVVRRASRVVRLVRPRGHNNFAALREKLGWG